MRIRPGVLQVVPALVLSACDIVEHPPVRDVSRTRPSVVTAWDYFPPGVIDSFNTEWIGRILMATGERPLTEHPVAGGESVLRMVWEPPFDPTVIVRLARRADRCTIVTIVREHDEYLWGPPDSTGLSESIGKAPGRIVRRDSLLLDAAPCLAAERALTATRAWSAPRKRESAAPDGSTWLFERRDAAGHRAFKRDTPAASDADLWRAGLTILRLGRAYPADGRAY